jgi:hypothetical protein
MHGRRILRHVRGNPDTEVSRSLPSETTLPYSTQSFRLECDLAEHRTSTLILPHGAYGDFDAAQRPCGKIATATPHFQV